MTGPQTTPTPGEDLKAEKMPGHWLLARLGKRVLRPGGRQLTRRMIEALNICPSDAVVEFAPGLGDTARLTLKRHPASYTAVERDKDAAALVQKILQGPNQRCVVGLAENTGLPDVSATVVYGEAMLSMQTPQPGRNVGPHASGPEAFDQGEDIRSHASGAAEVKEEIPSWQLIPFAGGVPLMLSVVSP